MASLNKLIFARGPSRAFSIVQPVHALPVTEAVGPDVGLRTG